MPISRKRKKKGKKVQYEGTKISVDPNKESEITIQDLINVVAYQEYKDAGVYDKMEELPGANWVDDGSNDQEESPNER